MLAQLGDPRPFCSTFGVLDERIAGIARYPRLLFRGHGQPRADVFGAHEITSTRSQTMRADANLRSFSQLPPTSQSIFSVTNSAPDRTLKAPFFEDVATRSA